MARIDVKKKGVVIGHYDTEPNNITGHFMWHMTEGGLGGGCNSAADAAKRIRKEHAARTAKLTPTQLKLIELLKDGYTVRPSEYHGRFGTTSASATKQIENTNTWDRPKISQATIDGLHKRGLVKYVGTLRDKRVVLV
jgi:hypothetical protein